MQIAQHSTAQHINTLVYVANTYMCAIYNG